MNDGPIVETQSLSKRYAGGTVAVRGITFQVQAGEIFGFLGPNGAGKSTTIMMLTTLIRPTGGKALVCGHDVVVSPDLVRRQLGYVSQDVAVDESLTGRENLFLQGKLYHLPPDMLSQRLAEVLEMVELTDHAHQLVSTYSGGMRKRLDIGAGLIHRPRLLFLDEPTLGLDIQTRSRIWEYIRRLRDEHGITIFLTTHYMEEADRLCDRVAIIDHGDIVALDKPSALKATVGGDLITVRLDQETPGPTGGLRSDPPQAVDPGLLRELEEKLSVHSATLLSNGTLQLVADQGDKVVPRLVDCLTERGVRVESISVKHPTLDDVFLRYTGRQLRQDEGAEAYRRMAMAMRRARR